MSDVEEDAMDVDTGAAAAAAAADEPAPQLAPGERLMITKMELENFKSYLGVQSVGPFHKVGLFGGEKKETKKRIHKDA